MDVFDFFKKWKFYRKGIFSFLAGAMLCPIGALGDSAIGEDGFHWVPNKGQWPQAVEYRADLPAGRVFLEKQGLTYAFLDGGQLKELHDRKFYEGTIDAHAIKLQFQGANSEPEIKGSDPTSLYYNFFLGNDASHWASKVHGQRKVSYHDLYEGIDLALLSKEGRLKYNFYVDPSGDPSSIQMTYEGADSVFIKEGHLHIQTSVNEFRELAPVAFQGKGVERSKVPCEFSLPDDRPKTVTFDFPEGYDKDEPLVIDPEVIFSTYSGSFADNFGYTATFDTAGNGYSGGTVFGPQFPTTSGAYQKNYGGGNDNTAGIGVGSGRDIGIIKYNDSGTNAKYITYLGGSHNEDPHSMVVNHEDDLLVFGNTGSANFPLAGNSYDTTLDGDYDMVVAKLSADGSTLKQSTFVGGSNRDGLNGAQDAFIGIGYTNISPLGYNYGDIFRGEIIVDAADNVWIASVTKSADYPVSGNAFQQNFGGGTQDACVTKLSADLSSLEYSTFLGGTADDAAYSIALADQGGVYVGGGTASNQFPFNFQGHQTTNNGGKADGFAAHFSDDLSTLNGSTLLGTSGYDQIYFLQTGPAGNVYVTGQTNSNQFPNFNTDYNTPDGKQFISKFNPSLDSLLWSSTFGSGERSVPDLSPSAFLVDKCGRIFFSGWGGVSNFKGNTGGLEVTDNAFQPVTNGSDFYLAVFARDMQKLLYGSYYGGGISSDHVDGGTSRFDDNGIVYQSVCAGCGGYSDLPTTPDAWSTVNNGVRPDGDTAGCNNALLKIDMKAQDLFSNFEGPENSCISDSVQFQNTSQLAESYYWDFGDGDTSTSKNPVHKYEDTGAYEVQMVAENLNSCTLTDTVTDSITIYDHAGASFTLDTVQCANSIRFQYQSEFGSHWHWNFGDSAVSKDENPVHTYKDTGWYDVRLIVDSGTACADTSFDSVHIDEQPIPDFSYTIDTCEGKLTLNNQSLNADKFLWVFEDTVSRPQSDTGTITHFYEKVGDLTATLIAQPGTYCADTLSKSFRLEIPKVDFRPEVVDTCNFGYALIDESRFTNTGHWSIAETGDSFQVSGDTLFYQFPGSGEYDVQMIADGPRGICVDSLTKTIEVDSLPDADFRYNLDQCSSFIELSNHARHAEHYRWEIRALNQPFDTAHRNPDTNRFFLPYSREVYEVSLIADPNSDCADTFTKQVTLDSAAHAEFEYDLDTCKQKVHFDNHSTRNAGYQWDLGDGKTTGTPEPEHLYSEPDSYDVQLIVGNGGCSDTMEKSLKIPEVPSAQFSLSRDHCSSLMKIENRSKFANRSYKWKIRQDTVIYANIDDFRVQDTGDYPVTLVAGPFARCPDTAREVINVDEFADARFNIDLDSCSGKARFKPALDSFGQYQWEFGNGQTSRSYAPGLTYDTSGSYQASLVNTFGNCKDTVTNPVKIKNPKARFVIDRKYCSPKVTLENLSTGSHHQKWLFGDGTKSFHPNPTKIYDDTGQYRIQLVANHNSACADTFGVTIALDEFVYPDFELIQAPCQPEISVRNQSMRVDSIHWSLGFEGEYPTDADTLTNIKFPEPGTYHVQLMTSNNACSDSLVRTIQIDSSVRAGFDLKKAPCMPQISLRDTSTNSNEVQWFFGDGESALGKRSLDHRYWEAGLYTITQVINPNGKCPDTTRRDVKISLDEVSEVKIPNVFTPNGDGKNDEFVVQGLNGCSGYELKIYNRWGDVVYRGTGEQLSWDGRDIDTGQEIRSGTYYYELKNGDFKQEGTITLIR